MLGTGTSSNPFLISTQQDLDNVRNNLSASYELNNDIDMKDWVNFKPIGTVSKPFTGSFNGKGYKIKSLFITNTGGYTGLFAFINNTSVIIQNVGIVDSVINGNSSNWVGAIVGQLNNGTISNCYSTGEINGQYMIGGIVGQFAGGTIEDCYSHATVSGVGRVGGLVGNISSATSSINNAYSIGKVYASGATFSPKALIGDNSGGSKNITNLYYNSEIMSDSQYGTGLTTTQFKDSSSFSAFSTDIWGFGDVPYLLQFGKPVIVRKVTVNANTSLNLISNSCRAIRRITRTNTNEIIETSHRLNKQLKTRSYSYLEDLVSNVKLVNAKMRQYVTISSIARIDSSVKVYKRSRKLLENLVEPLRLSTSVLTSIKDIPVYANVYTLENQTYSYISENQSVLFTNENQTELKVMK